MTAVGTAHPETAVPVTYDELADLYGDRIHKFVRGRLGRFLQPCDVEDVYGYVMMKLVETDVISQYDPGHIGGNGRPVAFLSFLMTKTALYMKGKAESISIKSGREPAFCDAATGTDGSTWAEMFGPAVCDQYPSLPDTEVMDRLRAALEGQDGPKDGPSLVELFDGLADEVAAGRNITPTLIRRRWSVSQQEAGGYLSELRAALATVVDGAPEQARYEMPGTGISLTASEVRAAIGALRASKGNRVLPAFEAIGSPLAAAGKTWYLAPAKAEQKLFPYLVPAKGGHYEGGHGSPVKAALIHWFERMLAGGRAPSSPDLPPEPPPSPWIPVEQALAGLPGATPAKVAAALSAAREAFA
jgi:hypothetical protein